MKQTEEQREGLVMDVVFDVYAGEQLSTRLYLSGYLYERLRTTIRLISIFVSKSGKTVEKVCQVLELEVSEKFQKELQALLNQEKEAVWTEELVKEYIACADFSMGQIRAKAEKTSVQVFKEVFGEQDSVLGKRNIMEEEKSPIKQPKEQNEAIVRKVVYELYPGKMSDASFYLEGFICRYIYGYLEKQIEFIKNMTFPMVKQVCRDLDLSDRFQCELRDSLEVVWTEDLVKAFIASEAFSMEEAWAEAKEAEKQNENRLLQAKNTPLEDCIPGKEVNW